MEDTLIRIAEHTGASMSTQTSQAHPTRMNVFYSSAMHCEYRTEIWKKSDSSPEKLKAPNQSSVKRNLWYKNTYNSCHSSRDHHFSLPNRVYSRTRLNTRGNSMSSIPCTGWVGREQRKIKCILCAKNNLCLGIQDERNNSVPLLEIQRAQWWRHQLVAQRTLEATSSCQQERSRRRLDSPRKCWGPTKEKTIPCHKPRPSWSLLLSIRMTNEI